MKNKFRIGEIVVVNGKGKVSEKNYKAIGIIKEKDYELNDYLVTIISDKIDDWFKEKDIQAVMDKRIKKKEKYKVIIVLNKKGLDYILEKIKKLPNEHNNILKKVDLYKEYSAFKEKYVILIWTSTYWTENNFAVKCIQDSIKEFRRMDIAYKQIIIGETDKTYIKINEFSENDSNVDIFNLIQKVEIKNIGGILV